jgi:ABC-type sugar transport system substrate-binding protein
MPLCSFSRKHRGAGMAAASNRNEAARCRDDIGQQCALAPHQRDRTEQADRPAERRATTRHHRTGRGADWSWLGGLVIAAALSVHPAWGGDLRVGFINPASPDARLQVSETMQAAAAQLGIDLDIRYTNREHDKTLALADRILSERPLPDYLVATNDIGAGGAIIKRAEAAGVPMILLSNDLDHKQWAEFGEPRTKYRHWLGSIVPDNEGGGYGIAEAILIEAARIKKTRPLKLLALAGDSETPAINDRIRGLKRAIDVMRDLLGPASVELVQVVNLDWTEKGAQTWVRRFVQTGPRIDALWASNDPMAFGAITALREAGYKPGVDVVVGGLNWSQGGVERVLNGEMLLTHGGHLLGGAWAMVILRDYHDGRDFAEEDVRLQFPMGAIDLPIARRFPDLGKVDWRQVDFTRFSKTRNPAVTRYNFTPDAVLSALASRY